MRAVADLRYNKSITELIACPNGLKGALTIQPTTEQLRNHSIAFCKQISSITIPTKMNHIGDYTFEGCYNLSYIKIKKQTPIRIPISAFSGVNKELCTLYVPQQHVESYRNSNGWKRFY